MNSEAKSSRPGLPASEAGPRRIALGSILNGEREVIITHGADEYRLRLTSNDKLLLTK